MSFYSTIESLEVAADYHRKIVDQCGDMAEVLRSIKPRHQEPMPVLELARALQPLGLCIVHRELVLECLRVIESLDDDEGVSSEKLHRLQNGLSASLRGGI